MMAKSIFVNLAVKDLQRSVNFFTSLGFKFNPQFTDDNATCMIISDLGFVMLLVEPFFKSFISTEIADARKSTEVINALSAESRKEVDDLMAKALAGGATEPRPVMDHGWMYNRTFQDLDGHLWELVFMDLANFPANPS
jgi:uncharacterized protein